MPHEISSEIIERFVSKCLDPKTNLLLENIDLYSYEKLVPYERIDLCILDCVYSLRVKYICATNVVHLYKEKFLNTYKADNNDSETAFLMNCIGDETGEKFASQINNHHYIDITRHIYKGAACYSIAKVLRDNNINYLTDFRRYIDIKKLETEIMNVHGIGKAACNYLFMLAGDLDRCKADQHIVDFVNKYCEIKISPSDYEQLLSEAVRIIKAENGYITLTVAGLDRLIWNRGSGICCRRHKEV